jgi:natural product biosynthesis luciferase-like monooxygenase protein
MDFSLFFFSSRHEGEGTAYDLVRAAARFADEHGFHAIWVPERHFRPFGGPFPNPAVIAAGLATVTERVRLHAGSVVVPLHDPLRIVEEWAVVDVLSGGRVGLSLASGWNADDFILAPQRYADRRAALADDVATIRHLWAGGTVERRNGADRLRSVLTYPRPIQAALPCWITSSRSDATIELAGRIGANLLLHLLYQDSAELGPRIDRYRRVRQDHGHDEGRVTLMLHTYLSDDGAGAAIAREPLLRYLSDSIDLDAAGHESTGRAGAGPLGEEDRTVLLERTLTHLSKGNSLLGTPAEAVATTLRLAAAGVDEIACLIDFGLPLATVTEGLNRLRLVQLSTAHELGVRR